MQIMLLELCTVYLNVYSVLLKKKIILSTEYARLSAVRSSASPIIRADFQLPEMFFLNLIFNQQSVLPFLVITRYNLVLRTVLKNIVIRGHNSAPYGNNVNQHCMIVTHYKDYISKK